MAPPSGKVTHVIFDYDGILVETEHLYTVANSMMLSKYGLEFTMQLKHGEYNAEQMDNRGSRDDGKEAHGSDHLADQGGLTLVGAEDEFRWESRTR